MRLDLSFFLNETKKNPFVCVWMMDSKKMEGRFVRGRISWCLFCAFGGLLSGVSGTVTNIVQNGLYEVFLIGCRRARGSQGLSKNVL